MKQAERLKAFLEQYQAYVQEVLAPTLDEAKAVFDSWKEPSYWVKFAVGSRMPIPSPVQRVHSRIKRPESVVDKILRSPQFFSDGLEPTSFKCMRDTIGFRVVAYFLSAFPMINRELLNSDALEVARDDPPTAYLSADLMHRLGLANELKRGTKESGYASVHYVVRLRESSVPRGDRPWFELQVRTLAEDIWAEIEHVLGYKPSKRTSFAVSKQFRILSAQLQAIDEHFNFVYEELCRFQEESAYSDSDPLNAENLAAVLAPVGLKCSQREVDSLLKVLVSRGVRRVRDFREVATIAGIELIRNTYVNVAGRAPSTFEVVANIANLHRVPEAEASEAVRGQIQYLQAWDSWKKKPRESG